MASIPDGAYNGTEVQFWFEGKMLYQQSSSGYYIGEDPYHGVTNSWLVKGPNGEPLDWYWDANFTRPISLGDDIYGHHYDEFGVTLFVAIYGKRMDIKLKMGAKTDLPSTKNNGTVYFAKDGDKNFGELYYDDENGNRVKIGGSNITSIEFCPESQGALDGVYQKHFLRITNEDGTYVDSNILPRADFMSEGVMSFANTLTEIQQMPLGLKSFYPGIIIGTMPGLELNNGYAIGIGDAAVLMGQDSSEYNKVGIIQSPEILVLATEDQDVIFSISNEDNIPGIMAMAGDVSFILENNHFWTDSLGAETNYIPTAYIESITANTITATAFTGLFTGNLSGNANTATQLLVGKNINGTLFNGSADITTESWGTARNVKISNQANASVDGLSVDGARDIVLTIPSTITNFVSITSTDLFGTNLGSKTSIWDTLHIENPIIYNPLDNSYFHKLVSKSNSTTGRTLNLPDSDGTLVFITSAIGDENSPAYVASSGQVQACTSIAVEHGGTGRDALTAGSLLVGNGTSAVTLVTGDTKGKILSSNGSSSAPSYVSPSLSWTDGGASGPTLKLSINSADTTSTIPIASGTVSGVVSTGEQTFGGKKIFSGAIQGNSTLAITGTSTFTGQITAANMILTGQLKSSANTSYSYMTLADTKITLKSSAIFLDGSKLLLNTTSSNMYGTTLPTTGLEEGRVFFLLV